MSVKKNYIIGALDSEKTNEVTNIVENYAITSMESSSHMFFDKQPINPNEYKTDILFFKLEAENERLLNNKLDGMIGKLEQLHTDLMLRDVKAEKFLMNISHGGILTIKFDNIKTIKKGTYKRIDMLKTIKN